MTMDKNDAIGVTLLGVSGREPETHIKAQRSQYDGRSGKPWHQTARQGIKTRGGSEAEPVDVTRLHDRYLQGTKKG